MQDIDDVFYVCMWYNTVKGELLNKFGAGLWGWHSTLLLQLSNSSEVRVQILGFPFPTVISF